MNKAILVGRLTKDPELKSTASGVSVCQFTVAVNRRFKNADGNYDADFINCVAWRQQAEFISKYFGKGEKIGIVGSIQTRTYDDKDGKKIYVTEVVVDEAYFVESKAVMSEAIQPTMNYEANDGFVPMSADDEDLPF